ncbi:MAG: hypothetical protein ABSB15_11440 [Bryobacteraceae bacterium]|jgi:uncharacterized protein (TIGR03437 family)
MSKPTSKTLFRALALVLCGGASFTAFAQSFTGFTPGNIVLSRSVYTGNATTLAAGQILPPVCPSTGACAANGGPATNNGAYPSLNSSNNVWNNDAVDGSFGITSPLFLDQYTPTGAYVGTLPIPPNMVSTSFSSKSEVALNLSADGTAITFMAYVTPPNTVDVSNANTPYAYDPTNPSGGSYYRAVVQVGANGAIQVTPTNSYSGNNGRAAVLANGLYYMVGNSNNGSGTPTNIIQTAGVQMAVPGQALGTPPVQLADFSISQVINSSTGLPYAPDKAGKDDNFRGLTIFDNTLYVSKGSGSNGINTVYRVGDVGSLPTLSNAASAALTVLPGFPNVPAKTAKVLAYPFGLFFANATTLYVADEGDGTAADAAGSTTAGLQKWILSNGVWTLAYTLQNGLNLGQPYSVPNYPTSLNPATDGLRNIAGQINGNGTVTIYAITSTVSSNGDQGADPNKLVAITDTIAATTLPAGEQFTTLRSAAAGEVLRGVCLTPTAGPTAAANVPLILSAANPSATAIAPGAVATANGVNLANTTASLPGPFPTSYSGTIVSILDAAGNTTQAPLLSVSPNQVTFLVPKTVAVGTAQITVSGNNSFAPAQTANNVEISGVAPGILTINGESLAYAYIIQVAANGTQTVTPAWTTNGSGANVPQPVVLGGGNKTYLILFGSGIAAAGTALTTVTINGTSATVAYAGSAGTGLDQVNVLIPASLAGAGNANVQLTAAGVGANQVQITIQ